MNPLPSVELIKAAAEKLGAFREEVVFVGGAVVGLLLTDPAAPAPRFTRDVDVVMNLMSRMDFYRAEDRLRALGFTGDPSGPVCRYLYESVVLDLLPSSPEVIGFASRWYPLNSADGLEANPRWKPGDQRDLSPLLSCDKDGSVYGHRPGWAR